MFKPTVINDGFSAIYSTFTIVRFIISVILLYSQTSQQTKMCEYSEFSISITLWKRWIFFTIFIPF